MIRLAVVTALLALALVVVKRRSGRAPVGDALRVTSRTGISRGVLAAVLEVEQRRFLVTITASSTTLVAELGHDGAPLPTGAAAPGETAEPAALAPPAPAPAGRPAAPAPLSPAEAGEASSFLDKIRARTLRSYDPALVAELREGR
jgi:hypothetical protein